VADTPHTALLIYAATVLGRSLARASEGYYLFVGKHNRVSVDMEFANGG
jgi:hypothetical protein